MGKVTKIEGKNVKPIVITDNETGYMYTLEFNRLAVEKAEKSGFTLTGDSLTNSPMSTISELWHWSFFMHHRDLSRAKTMELLEATAITSEVIERLALLYTEPFNALVATDEDDDSKNSRVTIQM